MVCARAQCSAPRDLNIRTEQDLTEIVARFLAVGEGVVAHWVEYARGLLLFVMAPGDERSGEFYVYDRNKGQLLAPGPCGWRLRRLLGRRNAAERSGSSGCWISPRTRRAWRWRGDPETRFEIPDERVYGDVMPDLLQATPEMAARVCAVVREPPRLHAAIGYAPIRHPAATTTTARASEGNPLELTPWDIQRHLAGEITLGIYAINPRTQRVKWMAIDADYRKRWRTFSSCSSSSGGRHPGGARAEPPWRASVDLLRERPCSRSMLACTSGTLPSKLSVEVKGSGPTERDRAVPEAGRIRRRAVRQRDPRAARRPSRGGPALLVLRRAYDLEAQMAYLAQPAASHRAAIEGA